MAWAGLAMQGVSSLMSAQNSKVTAGELRSDAGSAQAQSQVIAENELRDNKYVQSRAQAIAAGSGGGASDPTVINTISKIAGEGEYRALTNLYSGNVRAQTLKNQASAANDAAQAALISGAGSLAKGGASLYDKYGNGGPSSKGVATGDDLTGYHGSSYG